MFSKRKSHMKRILMLCFSLIQILPILGCGESIAGQKHPDVTFYAESRGLNTSLYMIFDLDKNDRLANINTETVVLSSPSKSVNPWTGFNSGAFIVVTGDDKAIIYGNTHFEEVISGNVKRNISVFIRKGIGEKAHGAVDGNIFSVGSDKNMLVGKAQFQEISTPSGEKRTVRVSQLLKPISKPMFALGDKIYALEKNNQLTQVGWVGWRKITTLEDKNQLVILMTKSMARNAKWAGRYDGKIYQDK